MAEPTVLERIKRAARMCMEHGRPADETDLFAEEDENGVVWIRREDGSVVAFMGRDVFDELGFVLKPKTT